MKDKFAIFVLIGVLLCLCTQSISPEEIRQKAIESSENIKTYKFKITMNAEIAFGNDSSLRSAMVSNISGAYDSINKRMFMKMVTIMDRYKESFQIESESYLIDNIIYMKMTFPNGTHRWVKTEMKNYSWNCSSQIEQQVDVLKISEVKRLADETVNGIDCYVLELKPDLDKFVEFMTTKQNDTQNISLLKDMLKDVRAKEWIAKDTFYPIKTEIITVMELPMSISIESINKSMSIRQVMNMTIELYDINKPVTIELPPEAENATSIPQTY